MLSSPAHVEPRVRMLCVGQQGANSEEEVVRFFEVRLLVPECFVLSLCVWALSSIFFTSCRRDVIRGDINTILFELLICMIWVSPFSAQVLLRASLKSA